MTLTHFWKVALLATEEDIASSFEERTNNDLFFFFGSFWPTVQDILLRLPPQPSSQALSATNLPGKSADRAETVAKLEHELAEQKFKLEEGIQQILQTHVAVANGDLDARAPFTQDNVLWQIARALNTLLVRLQRASRSEKELQRVEQAVNTTVFTIQRAEEMNQIPQISFTRTEFDPLIMVLQGKTLAYTPAPFARQSPPQTPKVPPSDVKNSRAPYFPPTIWCLALSLLIISQAV